ncbi:MAG: hypothetical protein EOO73_06880 [Myxococcales bacterium]|nr:MAG: hypothetical protein EOO73_06880 [Myxococcales bacterium]
MKKARRLLAPTSRLALALAALSASLSLRCGSDETTPEPPTEGVAGAAGQPSGGEAGGAPSSGVCEPGATRECVGRAACLGGQACSKDGSAWGVCDCGLEPSSAGAGSGGADGGAEGGGGAGGAVSPVSCKPAPQSGCAEGEKCSIVVVSATQTVAFDCVADGTKAEGAECALREDGTDNCAKGLFCNGVGTVPRCQPYCDVTDAEGCDTLCTELDVGHGGVSAPSGYGVCQPPCDLLAQDCDEGDACVFLETPFPVCAQAGAVEPGAACAFYDDCELGSACVLVNAEKTATMCTPFCAATEAGSCAAQGDTCLAFPMIYDPVPDELFTTGLCYPCELLGIPDCQLLAAGGCAEEADCDPLLDSMGFDFTCDARSGQCVMAAP